MKSERITNLEIVFKLEIFVESFSSFRSLDFVIFDYYIKVLRM